MPTLNFLPLNIKIEVAENTKILAAARRVKLPIRFGCGAGRCGTCAVRVQSVEMLGSLSPMQSAELEKLGKIGLPTDGSVRLSCQARIIAGHSDIDLDFQDSYDPSQSG